jgi:hypothetical protein
MEALLALLALAAVAQGRLSDPALPIPDPPDANARRAELWSYRAGACEGNATAVTNASFALGVIARGESAYIEEWVSWPGFAAATAAEDVAWAVLVVSVGCVGAGCAGSSAGLTGRSGGWWKNTPPTLSPTSRTHPPAPRRCCTTCSLAWT